MVATSSLCCHDAAFYWSGGGRAVFGLRRSYEIRRLESLAGKKVFGVVHVMMMAEDGFHVRRAEW